MKPVYNILRIKILFILFAGINFIASGTTYYVSNTGSDSNNGISSTSPYKTLDKINSLTLRPGDQVLFKKGDTFRGKITGLESGAANNPIVFGAYGSGEAPVFSGLSEVTNWVNLGNNIWESSSKVSSLPSCNVVIINGENTAMGRFPDEGHFTITGFTGATSVTSTEFSSSINWVGAELASKKKRWVIDRMKIEAQSGGTFTTSGPKVYTYNKKYGFIIQNHPATLTRQNEWYYNPSNGKLRIYSSSQPQNVFVSNADGFIELTYRNYITFTDLHFTGANDVAMFLRTTKYITVQNCTFSYCGDAAILGNDYMDGQPASATGCVVRNNTFIHNNNNAVRLTREFGNALITENTFDQNAVLLGMGGSGDGTYTAINVHGDGSEISYNTITNTGYQPISFDGTGSKVYRNYIDNFCFVKDDGAGIYCARPKQDREIVENIVLNGIGAPELCPPALNAWDVQGAAEGIYLDDNSEDVKVHNNTVYNCINQGLMLHRNAGKNDIQGNIFYDCSGYNGIVNFQSEDANVKQRNNVFKNNEIIGAEDGQVLLRVHSENVDINLVGDFDNNYYSNPLSDGIVIAWKDPNFRNAERSDLKDWTAFSGLDANSHQCEERVSSKKDLQFEYNASKADKVVRLSQPMMDVKGNKYHSSVTLKPFTAVVLMEDPNPNPDPEPDPDPIPDPEVDPVVPAFTVKTNNVITGETLQFTNHSANATSYYWTFGDGTTSSEENPTHAYTALGTYKVVLAAANEAGPEYSTTFVNVTLLPVSAKFSVKTTGVVAGETLTFSNSSSNADSYVWNFGDGTTSSAKNPTHSFSAAGTYTVTLTASSQAGTSKATAKVEVTSLPVTAKFAVKTTNVVTGEKLDFTNQSSNAKSYYWNFGDGTTSVETHPSHTYTNLGTYKVVLAAITDTDPVYFTQFVQVTLQPVSAKFSVKTSNVITGESLAFTNTSANADSYVWNFGDGNTSTAKNPTHSYSQLGTYTVTLTATGAAGTSKVTSNVAVTLQPVSAKFSVKTSNVVIGESLAFTNTSANADSYVWNFGDGNTSTAKNPTHSYSQLGTYTVTLTATGAAGTSKTTSNVAVTLQPVSAKFSVKTSNVVTGESLAFTNTSANADSYVWNFGDGSTSTAKNPTHSYSQLGTYTVTLTATGAAGTSKATSNVAVTLQPVSAKFSVKTSNVVTGESLAFTNTSSNADSYVWNFGDGSTSTAKNPTHSYSQLGTYTVTLTATGAAGTSKTTSNVAVTLQPVSAKFSVKTSNVVTGESLAFTNTSANADSYVWNFGDGNSSTAKNPTHSYSQLGTYTVTLIATGAAGTSKATSNVAVTVEPVKADFSVENAEVLVNKEVRFANASHAADSYLWEFGDGQTSTAVNARHIYTSKGVYSVKLTATGKSGNATKTSSVIVNEDEVVDPEPLPQPVQAVAAFSVNKTSDIVTGEELKFTNASEEATSFSWNFGDGNTSDEIDPVHVYTKTGEYTVTLTAINKETDSIVSKRIHVNLEPVQANFSPSKIEVYEGEEIAFANASLHADTYTWNFGDGNRSTEVNPVHTYLTSGDYTVELMATGKSGTAFHTAQVRVVVEPATAQFTVSASEIIEGEAVTFTNTSLLADTYQWSFGDGSSSEEINPIHTYGAAGVYSVTLVARNRAGASEAFTKDITVSTKPAVAKFSTLSTEVWAGDEVEFTNESENAEGYSWNFGDGNTSEAMHPTHTFDVAGTYNVSLTVENAAGTSSPFAIQLEVLQPNTAPVALGNTFTTPFEEALSITLAASDADGDVLDFEVVDAPKNGTLSGSNADLTYTPNADFSGRDTFTFVATDGELVSNQAMVVLTVKDEEPDPKGELVNTTPVAFNASVEAAYNTSVKVNLTGTDADADPLTFILLETPAHGTLDGTLPTLTYTPISGYTGADSIRFMVSDGKDSSNIATINLHVAVPVEEPELTSELIAHWSFDEAAGSTVLDNTGNGYDGEMINGIRKELGQVNSAMEFDGASYVNLDAHVHAFAGLSEGAISIWFKTSATDAGRLFSATNSNDFSSDLVVNCKDGFLNYAVRDNNVAKLVVRSQFNTYNDEKWHNVVINIGKASNQIYVDGEAIKVSYIVGTASSNEFFSSVSNLDVLRIGNGQDKNNGNEDFFAGLQDEVKIYNLALTPEEIKEQYDFVMANRPQNAAPVALPQNVQVVENYKVKIALEASDFNDDELTYSIMEYPIHGELSGDAPNVTYTPAEGYVGDDYFTFMVNDGSEDSQEATVSISVVSYKLAESLQEGLVGHWKLDEKAGGIASDASGNNLDGDVYNEKWQEDGKVDGAISFNGRGFVNLDPHVEAVQQLDTGSISLWFNTTINNAGRLFSASDKSAEASDVMVDIVGGQLNVTVRNEEELLLRVSTQDDNLSDGEWHLAVINMGADGCKIYIDGLPADVYFTAGTATSTHFFAAIDNLDALRIGNGQDADHGNEDFFKGAIDDVRLYNRTLETSEVESLLGSATDDSKKRPYLKESNLAEISTWPNPAANFINIDFPDAGNYTVVMYNTKGQLMYQAEVVDIKTHAVGIGHYENGLYIVKVTDHDNGDIYTETILKKKY